MFSYNKEPVVHQKGASFYFYNVTYNVFKGSFKYRLVKHRTGQGRSCCFWVYVSLPGELVLCQEQKWGCSAALVTPPKVSWCLCYKTWILVFTTLNDLSANLNSLTFFFFLNIHIYISLIFELVSTHRQWLWLSCMRCYTLQLCFSCKLLGGCLKNMRLHLYFLKSR